MVLASVWSLGSCSANGVHSPALDRRVQATAHTPAQHDVLTDRSGRQVHCCSDEPTRVSCPRHATSKRVTTAHTDRAIVATGNKAAAGSNDVSKCASADADLQHAAVKATLQVVVVAKTQLRRRGNDGYDRRIESLVTDAGGVIHPRRIRQRISNWRRQSGI